MALGIVESKQMDQKRTFFYYVEFSENVQTKDDSRMSLTS